MTKFAPRHAQRPTWARPREIPGVIAYPPHLKRSLATALVVGTILFTINQLDVVLADGWTLRVAIKSGLTYLVPFCVTNVGILTATKRPASRPSPHPDPEAPEARS